MRWGRRDAEAAYPAEVLVPIAEVLVPLAEVLAPIAEVLAPLAEVLVPLAEVLVPLAEVLVPLAEVLVPLAEVLVSFAEVLVPLAGVLAASPYRTGVPVPDAGGAAGGLAGAGATIVAAPVFLCDLAIRTLRSVGPSTSAAMLLFRVRPSSFAR